MRNCFSERRVLVELKANEGRDVVKIGIKIGLIKWIAHDQKRNSKKVSFRNIVERFFILSIEMVRG